MALLQDKLPEYFQKAKEMGFSAIEVSDGTIEMTREVREKVIRMAF
ncbi:MAG: phosphosulfolactate synthase, partial [Clostridiales bacterium]|nr:phosphosulfolactate synthase [Clostridiales bacterium]